MGLATGPAAIRRSSRSNFASLRAPEVRGPAQQLHHSSASARSLRKANQQSNGSRSRGFAAAASKGAWSKGRRERQQQSSSSAGIPDSRGSLRKSAGYRGAFGRPHLPPYGLDQYEFPVSRRFDAGLS